jgi:hypothetical protein
MKPRPAKPRSIIAHVDASGTVDMPVWSTTRLSMVSLDANSSVNWTPFAQPSTPEANEQEHVADGEGEARRLRDVERAVEGGDAAEDIELAVARADSRPGKEFVERAAWPLRVIPINGQDARRIARRHGAAGVVHVADDRAGPLQHAGLEIDAVRRDKRAVNLGERRPAASLFLQQAVGVAGDAQRRSGDDFERSLVGDGAAAVEEQRPARYVGEDRAAAVVIERQAVLAELSNAFDGVVDIVQRQSARTLIEEAAQRQLYRSAAGQRDIAAVDLQDGVRDGERAVVGDRASQESGAQSRVRAPG